MDYFKAFKDWFLTGNLYEEVSCAAGDDGLDLMPVPHAAVRRVSRWLKDPANADRKLLLALGEGHSTSYEVAMLQATLAHVQDHLTRAGLYQAPVPVLLEEPVNLLEISCHKRDVLNMYVARGVVSRVDAQTGNLWALKALNRTLFEEAPYVHHQQDSFLHAESLRGRVQVVFADAAREYNAYTTARGMDPLTNAALAEALYLLDDLVTDIELRNPRTPAGMLVRNLRKWACIKDIFQNSSARIGIKSNGQSHIFGTLSDEEYMRHEERLSHSLCGLAAQDRGGDKIDILPIVFIQDDETLEDYNIPQACTTIVEADNPGARILKPVVGRDHLAQEFYRGSNKAAEYDIFRPAFVRAGLGWSEFDRKHNESVYVDAVQNLLDSAAVRALNSPSVDNA
jgi:hypothetical protein